jgi:hypothetical protein
MAKQRQIFLIFLSAIFLSAPLPSLSGLDRVIFRFPIFLSALCPVSRRDAR